MTGSNWRWAVRMVGVSTNPNESGSGRQASLGTTSARPRRRKHTGAAEGTRACQRRSGQWQRKGGRACQVGLITDHRVTAFIRRPRGAMKSVEEGEAGSAGVAGPLMRPLYFPRLTGSRAGQGHSRGMKREEKGEGDSIALRSTEKGEERAVGVARVPFISRCRRLLK